MKKYAFLIVGILFLFSIGACSDTNDPVAVNNHDFDNHVPITADAIHTEFLNQLYSKGDFAKCAKSSQTQSAKKTANQILTKYGLDEMNDVEVEAALQQGRDMAQMDPDKLIASILDADDYIWWNRFANEATAQNCRQVYENHCRIYGTPTSGSTLETMTGIAMSSGEFWSKYRKNDIPRYNNPYVPQQSEKSWRGFFRFVVAVAVDGGSGALVSGGGPVASGVVGGLASTGADHIIFGDD